MVFADIRITKPKLVGEDDLIDILVICLRRSGMRAEPV